MPRTPQLATKKDLELHKKEVKKMLRQMAKKDKKEDDKKYQPKRKLSKHGK